MENSVQEAPNIFATIASEETISIVIPLYGFFKDGNIPEFSGKIDIGDKKMTLLQLVLQRFNSYYHKVYFIFVGEGDRIDDETSNTLYNKSIAGNVKGVNVEKDSSYLMYLEEGIRSAIENTNSKFIVCINPWVMLQKDSIDQIIERINKIDVNVVSGFDARKSGISSEEFDGYKFNPVREYRESIDLNFFAITRTVAEMITSGMLKIDTEYKTQYFANADFFQTMVSRGIQILTSQIASFYTFDIDWSSLENEEEFEFDKNRFLEKWKFNVQVEYPKHENN